MENFTLVEIPQREQFLSLSDPNTVKMDYKSSCSESLKSNNSNILVTKNDIDYANKFPDEILLMIFSQLSKKNLKNCALVCRRWHRICCDQRLGLWSKIRINKVNTMPLSSLANLIQRGARDLRLLDECFIRDPESWDNIFPVGYMSKLEYLDLSKLTISEEGLALILQRTGHLIRLNVGFCSLDQDCCKAICRNKRVEYLNLKNSSIFSPKGLQYILKRCKRLAELNIGCTELSEDALDNVIPLLNPSLTALNISGMVGLRDRHLFHIARVCPRLEDIDISRNFLLTISCMDAIYGLRYLKYFYYTKYDGFPK